MLRIQKHITFKDPVGREYTTDTLLLSLRDQAEVYTVRDNSRYLFVHFSGDLVHVESHIKAMTAGCTDKRAQGNLLWPKMECYQLDNDMLCGFLAPRIDLSSDVRAVRELIPAGDPDMETVICNLTVGLNLAKCIHAFHQASRRFTLGIPQPDDFHADADGRVFFCYAYRNIPEDPFFFSESWYRAPEYIIAQKGFTPAGDAFSFALILFELLTGRFPFGVHDPDADFDPAQITDMILNGESLYYYANMEACMELENKIFRISPVLSEMFRLAFDYCGRSRYEDLRPSIGDWIEALERITDTFKGENRVL